jgi:hypothetical protein
VLLTVHGVASETLMPGKFWLNAVPQPALWFIQPKSTERGRINIEVYDLPLVTVLDQSQTNRGLSFFKKSFRNVFGATVNKHK